MSLLIVSGSRAVRPMVLAAWLLAAPTGWAEAPGPGPSHGSGEVHDDFDVVIAGGSTAAFAAALAAAERGSKTALIEPTDWIGGQLTSSGVPAVDEAWHTIKPTDENQKPYSVSAVARTPANISPGFLALLKGLKHPADCWVSRFCFCPDEFVVNQLEPLQRAAGDRLTVFLDTVVKRAETSADGSRIVAIECIARTPRPGVGERGYDRLPSEDLVDWYAAEDSPRFTKRLLRFQEAAERTGGQTVFVDATEWGEVLALSGRPFLQGVEDADGSLECRDRCGQATVFCFAQELHAEPVHEPDRPVAATELGFGSYRDKPDAWAKIWTYRRIRGRGPPAAGDVCLQNWGYSVKDREGGNDYPFAYLFVSRERAAAERTDWRGGIDLEALRGAEDRAFGWHQWFRSHAPEGIDAARISLCPAVLGTGHGLAKLPYIRDTRRAIGLDGFVLRFADLTGPAPQRTGTVFPDRVALGAYPADIHPIAGCDMPAYCQAAHDTLPFCIPFRALTHRDFGNLLVVGKTMAQSFLANSATRLHPIEWSTGSAGGVAAAHMARTGRSSREALAAIGEIQAEIRTVTPIDWTLPSEQTQAAGP